MRHYDAGLIGSVAIQARSATVRRTLAVIGMASVLTVGCTGQGARQASNPTRPPRPAPTLAIARIDGALAYVLDGAVYVAEWDGSNPVMIKEGLPLTEEQSAAYLDADVKEGSRQEEPCGPGEYWASGPIWSPDGRFLAYRHTACDGHHIRGAWSDVVISDLTGKVISRFPSEGWGIAWSPDSLRVAVWDRWPSTVGVYGIDGVRQTLLKVPPGSTMGETDPMWSPDGGSILLQGGLAIPLDGGTPRLLPWWEPRVGWAYSPDGRRVALHGRGSVVIVEADGSDPRGVFEGGAWQPVVWSPAGDRMAFTSKEGLNVLDVATGTTSLNEVDGLKDLYVIEFSPQGDRILFYGQEGGSEHALWSVNIDGSDLRRLVAGIGSGDWSPRGET